MNHLNIALAGLVLVIAGVDQAKAEVLTFDFDSGLGPNFTVFDRSNSLYTVDTDGPTLRVSKVGDDGSYHPNQFISAGIKSAFEVGGDFSITVDFALHDFPATGEKQLNESLIAVMSSSGGVFSVLRFRLETQNLIEVFAIPPSDPFGVTSSSLATGRYRIARTGSTVTGSYASSGSSAFTSIASVGGFSDPMSIQLSSHQGLNEIIAGRSTTSLDISFDNLIVEADTITGIVPEPTTSALALTALCLAISRRRSFLDGRPV